MANIMVVNSPNLPGYRVVRVLGVVSGITARTRGVGGKFIAGIQGMFGGEVTAFSSEIEKARVEALERMEKQAVEMGANAIINVDVETSDVFQSIVLLSVTGTAEVVEKE